MFKSWFIVLGFSIQIIVKYFLKWTGVRIKYIMPIPPEVMA
jgi:hypothetical protein